MINGQPEWLGIIAGYDTRCREEFPLRELVIPDVFVAERAALHWQKYANDLRLVVQSMDPSLSRGACV